jgi:hypothetical protein
MKRTYKNRRESNIKNNIKEMNWGCGDWVHRLCTEISELRIEYSGAIKCCNFLSK